MALDLLRGKLRQPAECVVKVGRSATEITELYPFLVEVEVETSRHEAWVGRLVFESRREASGKWTVQDAGVFKPWEPISIAAAFATTTDEILRGFVRKVQADYPEDPGSTTVTVECRDESLALDRRQVRKVWGREAPTSDRAILAEILAAHRPLTLDPKSGAGLSNLVVSQDGTDIQFLQERAEANGFELYFDRGTVYFGPQRVKEEAQPTILVYAGPDTHCISLSIAVDGHLPDKVAFDVAATQGAGTKSDAVAPNLRPLGPKPAAAAGTGLQEFVWHLARHGSRSVEELRARALGKANEAAFKVRAEGELDGSLYGHVLRVGRPVPVDGTGDLLSGTYYVDRVTHTFTLDGYRQAFTLLRNALGDNIATAGGAIPPAIAPVV